jgi:hypothetical protein
VNGGGVSGGVLYDCTLTGNTAGFGGAAHLGTLHNCTLAGNSANDEGGGANSGVLYNCILTGNSADYGGGAAGCELINCILTSNSAGLGGGAAGGDSYVSTLRNCILSSNTSDMYGGGAYLSELNNCALIGNSAIYWGGGAFRGELQNCTLMDNTAGEKGGGFFGDGFGWEGNGTLTNCTLIGNSAGNTGGGVYVGNLKNCIVYYNSAPIGANHSGGGVNYCCTTPLATNGLRNITNAPLFVNQAGGNLRLQTNSPCINSGYNGYAPAGPDLDGNPRIVGGTVDIGAYEFQGPGSVISYAWLQQYGLPTDGSADYPDSDTDGLNNSQEWHAGTNPTNALSVFQMLSPTRGVSGLTVSWESVSGRNYFLEHGTYLAGQPPFSTLATNIVGQAGTTSFTDTNAVGTGPFYYRVGIQE